MKLYLYEFSMLCVYTRYRAYREPYTQSDGHGDNFDTSPFTEGLVSTGQTGEVVVEVDRLVYFMGGKPDITRLT